MTQVRATLAFGLMFLLHTVAGAAEPPDALVTRTYDLAEMILPARPDDEPDPTPRTLAPDQPIGHRSFTRSESREQLDTLIRETIDPKSWAPAGAGRLRVEGNSFVVTQTAENHRGLANLLDQLRGDASTRVHNKFASARLPAGTRFDKAELADAIFAVSKAVDVPIDFDWPEFTKRNVHPDAAVTADVSGQTAPRAVRTLVRAASGNAPLALSTEATAKRIRVTIDRTPADRGVSRVFDVRHLPARAAGLDPKKEHPRDAVVDALVARVQKQAGTKSVRETGGHLIVTANSKTLNDLTQFLEDLEDAPAVKP